MGARERVANVRGGVVQFSGPRDWCQSVERRLRPAAVDVEFGEQRAESTLGGFETHPQRRFVGGSHVALGQLEPALPDQPLPTHERDPGCDRGGVDRTEEHIGTLEIRLGGVPGAGDVQGAAHEHGVCGSDDRIVVRLGQRQHLSAERKTLLDRAHAQPGAG
ncbi:MAG TPA: hypothetical protein VFI30_07000 [Nocardioidaceae bacterium]|nr:hypothetical protein [Nocardioidaceae bacterium]